MSRWKESKNVNHKFLHSTVVVSFVCSCNVLMLEPGARGVLVLVNSAGNHCAVCPRTQVTHQRSVDYVRVWS